MLRGYLSKLGEHAKDAAIYWKYGCWFYEQKTRSQVLIESRWDNAASEVGAGDIRFRAWGENAENLIDTLPSFAVKSRSSAFGDRFCN